MPLFVSPHANYTFCVNSPETVYIGNKAITPNAQVLKFKKGQCFVKDTDAEDIFRGISNKDILAKLRKDRSYGVEFIEIEDTQYVKNVKPEAPKIGVTVEARDAHGRVDLPEGVAIEGDKPKCSKCGQVCKDLQSLARHIEKCLPKETANDASGSDKRSPADSETTAGSERSETDDDSGGEPVAEEDVPEPPRVGVPQEESDDSL